MYLKKKKQSAESYQKLLRMGLGIYIFNKSPS